MLEDWRKDARAQLPPELQPPPFPEAPAGSRISSALERWAESAPRPLVIFLDEFDALRDKVLGSVLRQLWSVHVKVLSLTFRDFTAEEVAELYQQHTADTGQHFEPEALALAFELTGQPWLVNSLAKVAVEELVREPSQPVRREHVEKAKALLIERRETHLDSLAARLREPRVRRILEPMLAGLSLGDVPEDDVRFVQDLGLVRMSALGGLEVANPIYRQIIPRVLTGTTMASLPPTPTTWLRADGRLDAERLMETFLSFWRQHGQPLMGSSPYHEIAPHVVLMAFLHLAGLGLDKGWLVIFDRRKGRPPIAEQTQATQATTPKGRQVTVVRA